MPLNFNIDPMVSLALEDVAEEIHGLILESIEDAKWEWPRETRRRNGEVVGSPRDIVDTGNLRDGQYYEIDGTTITFGNNAEYAAIVHEGYGSDYPERRFISDTLAENDPMEMVAERLGYWVEQAGNNTRFRDDSGRFANPGEGVRDIDADINLGA
jgi:hypothetical protein